MRRLESFDFEPSTIVKLGSVCAKACRDKYPISTLVNNLVMHVIRSVFIIVAELNIRTVLVLQGSYEQCLVTRAEAAFVIKGGFSNSLFSNSFDNRPCRRKGCPSFCFHRHKL